MIFRFLILGTMLLSAGSLHADDLLIVLNKDEATAWLIEPSSGEVVAKLDVGTGPHEAAVSPDGRTAVVCNYGTSTPGNTLSVIDIADRSVVRTIDLGSYTRPHGIGFYPDGRHVVVTSETTGKLVKVDMTSGEVGGVYDSGGDSHMVVLNEDATIAYSTSIQSGLLGTTDLTDPYLQARLVVTGTGTEAVALSPDESEVWVALNGSSVIKVIDPASMIVKSEFECGWFPIRLAFLPDGHTVLATGMLSGDLVVIDADTKEILRRVRLGEFTLAKSEWMDLEKEEGQALVAEIVEKGPRPIGILPAPDGKLVFVANRGLDEIAVVDTESWEVIRRIPTGKGPDGMAWGRRR